MVSPFGTGTILLRSSKQGSKEIHRSLVEGRDPFTDAMTAEMTKLVENGFRGVNVAFAKWKSEE